jgi:hypothetical protein
MNDVEIQTGPVRGYLKLSSAPGTRIHSIVIPQLRDGRRPLDINMIRRTIHMLKVQANECCFTHRTRTRQAPRR